MEAFIRVFRNHCTAMMADVDSRIVVAQRSFAYTPISTISDAQTWLMARGFAKDAIEVYDWTATDGRTDAAMNSFTCPCQSGHPEACLEHGFHDVYVGPSADVHLARRQD